MIAVENEAADRAWTAPRQRVDLVSICVWLSGDPLISMAGRSDTYFSRSDVDSIEDLSKRLTADLRRHIRALVRRTQPTLARFTQWRLFHSVVLAFSAVIVDVQGPCDVLSDRWKEIGDTLGRVAAISHMVRPYFRCKHGGFMHNSGFNDVRTFADGMRTRGPMQEMSLPKSEGASLWDCEELALRYVIEDGKLNL